jgi:type I restriction enzyme S subunit
MLPYLRAANVKDGVLDLADIKEMNFSPSEQEVFSLRPGDILVTEGSGSLSTVGASAVWSGEIEGRVCFQNTLLRLRPRPGTDTKYLAWWCRHAFSDGVFAGVAMGANIFHVSAERVRGLPMGYIPLVAQRAIADYLDAETARIDALIEKKRRVIECLDERLEVFIRVRLLTSGAPTRPLKRTWIVTDCRHRTPDYVDSGYPVISPGDATPGRLDLSRAHRFVDEDDLRDLTGNGRRPRRGDIIYSRNASIGIASYVDTDAPFCMGQDVCLITSEGADQLYLTYVLNTLGADQLDVQKIGSTFSRVNISQIIELPIPTPALDEQRVIARELDEHTMRRDRAVNRLVAQLELLVEHRQAIITAAVTGAIDIPGVAA